MKHVVKKVARLYMARYLRELEEETADNFRGEPVYGMTLKDDTFVHFTYEQRAQEIIDSGVLLLDAPYKGFGAYAVFAVSAIYGSLVPGVQLTHLREDEPIVAVVFKTNLPPDIGFRDEVSWDRDVPLKNARIVSKQKGISMIKSAPEKIASGSYVFYR